MRVKQLWAVIPLPSKLKLAYSRVTLNLPTTVFFVLALMQCIFLNILHIRLYTEHQYANQKIEPFALNTTLVTFPIAIQTGDELLLCKGLPTFVDGPDECIKAHISTSALEHGPLPTLQPGASGHLRNVTLVDPVTHKLITVPQQCVDVMPWVYQTLRATDREDIACGLYHIWYFGISLGAILHQSIPHLIAALILGAIGAGGSVFRTFATSGFQNDFKRIAVNGSCNGYDILGDSYFQSRRIEEILVCVLNNVAFVVSAALSWHLFKTYGQRSFERVHKRRDMSRLYIVILTMGACIQVAVHYMVTSIALFIDQLTLGPIRDLAHYKLLYLVTDIVMLVLIVPWGLLGWTAGRKESKRRTLIFLFSTVMYMATWAAMFTSRVFRLLMKTWGFFIVTSAVPMVLLIVILLLALYSWWHLDLGLAEYLKAEEPPHPADKVRWSLAVTSDPEKGHSPLSEKGNTEPQVTWVHLPAPIVVKPPPAVQKATRSPSKSSLSSAGSGRSNGTISRIPSSLFARSRPASLQSAPYLLPPPGLIPAPLMGLPVTSVSTSPNGAYTSIPPFTKALRF